MMYVNLNDYQEAVAAAIEEIEDNKILSRIWSHDYTVWGDAPTEISNRLGWLHMPQVMLSHIGRLQEFARSIQADGYTQAVVLGMGGSSLAPEVFAQTFGQEKDAPLRISVLDSTDPDAILALTESLDLTKTLFIVSTKSGGTVETLSFFKYFYNKMAEMLGAEAAGRHFIAITDPGSKLVTLAEEHRFRDTFLNDSTIGGRYSALSYFGLVPAALLGIDLEKLLTRAQAKAIKSQITIGKDNRAEQLGVIMSACAQAGRDKMTLITSAAIASFGNWVEQLIAESTGKEGKGILPVVGEVVGTPDVYGEDRLFVYLRLDGDESYDEVVKALETAGHPVVILSLADLYDLGTHYFLWQMATAIAGCHLHIQPFNQPNVESAKVLARQMVMAYQEEGQLPNRTSAPLTADALHDFLSQAQPGDYIALQAYLPPTLETDKMLQILQTQLRDRYRLAVTVGYGPRFLHSTGQLHKGDGGNGLFVQLTSDPITDVSIPDEAGVPAEKTGAAESNITFGILKMAQALGDAQALQEAGRRIIWFHLKTAVYEGLNTLITGDE